MTLNDYIQSLKKVLQYLQKLSSEKTLRDEHTTFQRGSHKMLRNGHTTFQRVTHKTSPLYVVEYKNHHHTLKMKVTRIVKFLNILFQKSYIHMRIELVFTTKMTCSDTKLVTVYKEQIIHIV